MARRLGLYGRVAPIAFAALLFTYAVLPIIAAEPESTSRDNVAGSAQDDPTPESTAVTASADDITAGGILAKLQEFPGLGEQGAGLLQLAEEGLGINASKLELSKIIPMLMELQKNVHDHYVVTRGKGKYKPSSLLKRVISRKSQTRVIKSMKKFAPDTDDGELMQQLDVVTQLLHELHTNPGNNMQSIMQTVSRAVGLDLHDDEMQKLTKHMQWAQELVQKLLPFLPGTLSGEKAEEL